MHQRRYVNVHHKSRYRSVRRPSLRI